MWGCEVGADWVRGNGGWESKTWKENAAYKEEEWEWEATHACRAKRVGKKIGVGFKQNDDDDDDCAGGRRGGCFWSAPPSFG